MDNLNAQLELRFELIRNITPKYSQYKYAESDNFDLVDADNSKVAKGLRKASKTAKKWTTVDVDSAAKLEGFNRGDAVRKLQEWSNNGAIELQPSGVINRFRILKEFPQNQMAKDTIVANIYRRIKERERDELERIQYVIGLITARACISRGLAMHFGDQQSVPLTGCGHCSYCHTKRGVSFSRDQKWDRKGRISESAIKAILKTTDIRDDPHFLARVAFGVRSPRVTKEKLSKHEVFGSMENCDFEVRAEWYSHLSIQLIDSYYRSWSKNLKRSAGHHRIRTLRLRVNHRKRGNLRRPANPLIPANLRTLISLGIPVDLPTLADLHILKITLDQNISVV